VGLEFRTSLRKFGSALPMILFGLPFFLIGSFFVLAGIGGFLGLVQSDLMGSIFAVIFGSIFALVGGFLIVGGARSFGPQSSRPKGEVLGRWTGGDSWPAFPKERSRGRGPRGGTILKAEVTRGMALGGLLLAAVLWNGISWVSLWAVTFHDKGAPCFVKAMIWAFCAIGIGIVVGAIRHVVKMAAWRGTRVKVQKELLMPGESTRVSVVQDGSFEISQLQLSIVCRERATYRVGTKTKTSNEEVWSQVFCDKVGLRAQGSRTMVETELEIPGNAMHSFQAGNNSIDWLIRLEMNGPGRVALKEEYPVRVAPEVKS